MQGDNYPSTANAKSLRSERRSGMLFMPDIIPIASMMSGTKTVPDLPG